MNKIVIEEELSCKQHTPGLDEISKEISGKQFKDTVSQGVAQDVFINTTFTRKGSEEKTLCQDEVTCVALNEFLDNGYKPQENLNFILDNGPKYVTLTIDTSNMGVRDRMELGLRIMKFVTIEIEKLKNGN